MCVCVCVCCVCVCVCELTRIGYRMLDTWNLLDSIIFFSHVLQFLYKKKTRPYSVRTKYFLVSFHVCTCNFGKTL